RPGNYELPMGIPFRDLLELCGGMKNGHALKAVIPGGSSVPVVPAAAIMDATMDYNGLKKIGTSFGTGAVVVIDETTCMVALLRRISRFYYAESCGQCTPCREGTGWLYRMLSRILDGEGRREDLGLLVDVANRIEGHTICALGDAAAWPVQSFLRHFMHEFEYMIDHKGRSITDPRSEVA
ncbi:MAG: SLBB domain-containing protein, partial [Gammaproteobacteria bacterium]|nr:SLBB domain-containing protein [Gammaproteobacteria bacterium]